VSDTGWFGLPTFSAPQFQLNWILLALPGVIAVIAENTRHVKAVRNHSDDVISCIGRALFADLIGTALSSAIGGRRPPRGEHRRDGGHPGVLRRRRISLGSIVAIVAYTWRDWSPRGS
jgi:Permease family